MEENIQPNPAAPVAATNQNNNVIFTVIFAFLVLVLVGLSLFMWSRRQMVTNGNTTTSQSTATISSTTTSQASELDDAVNDIEKDLSDLEKDDDFADPQEQDVIR